MKKIIINSILIIAGLIMIFNVIFLSTYSNKPTGQASAQASISLLIEGSYCGDSACDSGETCSSCLGDCGSCAATTTTGGGGGGATTKSIKKDFSVEPILIKIVLKQGESFKTSIRIQNTEKTPQSFDISVSPSLKDILSISETSVTLQPDEEKVIYLNFISNNSTEPNVYTGNIEVKTPYKTKQVPVIATIKSEKILFDVSLDIPIDYKEVLAGEELVFQITLFNLGEKEKSDVELEYIVKNFQGELIVEQKETVTLENQDSFSRTIKLPKEIPSGDYVAIVQAKYQNSVGSSSVMFHVSEKESLKFVKNKYFFVILIVVVLLILIVFFLERQRKNLKTSLKKQSNQISRVNKKIKKEKIKTHETNKEGNKFQKQLSALEKAYSQGYIKKESYEKGRKKIMEKLRS